MELDEFSKHELTDRSYCVLEMFNRLVNGHQATQQGDDLQELTSEISDKLYELYNLSATYSMKGND